MFRGPEFGLIQAGLASVVHRPDPRRNGKDKASYFVLESPPELLDVPPPEELPPPDEEPPPVPQ